LFARLGLRSPVVVHDFSLLYAVMSCYFQCFGDL
jgi:hypothetical protein